MTKGNSEPISPELLAVLKNLESMSDRDVDFSDIPEFLDWSGAGRGKYYRL